MFLTSGLSNFFFFNFHLNVAILEEAKKETLRGLFQFWTGVSSIRMFEETFHSEYKYTKRTFELWVKHQLEESHSQL